MDKDPIIRQYPINVHKLFCLTLLLVLAMFYAVMDQMWKINDSVKRFETDVDVEIFLNYPPKCPHCGAVHGGDKVRPDLDI